MMPLSKTDSRHEQIMIMGVGCLLLTDEGFGIHVINELKERYAFPDNVSIVDGGVLGVNLLGVISKADHLIVIDVIRNQGKPGDCYRLDGKAIPERIRAKNSLHQIDLLEALTLCQALEKVPETVIIGVEPEDMESLSVELTPTIAGKKERIITGVLEELDRLGVAYTEKSA